MPTNKKELISLESESNEFTENKKQVGRPKILSLVDYTRIEDVPEKDRVIQYSNYRYEIIQILNNALIV